MAIGLWLFRACGSLILVWGWRRLLRFKQPDRVSDHWIHENGYDKRGY